MDLRKTLKVIRINEPTISAVLGALVVLAVAILFVNYLKNKTSSSPTIATGVQTESKPKEDTLPTKYTVVKGDHLWKIAEKYYQSGLNWTDIAKANNLKNPSLLTVGQELTIPQAEIKTAVVSNKQALANAPPATTQQANSKVAPIQSISGDTYKVVKGDSLWKIAVRAYGDGYQWPKLAKTNKLKNPNKILVGQTIKLSH